MKVILNTKKMVVANRVSLGDSHDQSIEHFLNCNEYKCYIIWPMGGRYKVAGCIEEIEKVEVKDAGTEKKAGPPEEKPVTGGEPVAEPKPVGKPKSTGKRKAKTK